MNKISFNVVLCIAVFHLLSLTSASEIPSRAALVFGGDKGTCVCGVGKKPKIIAGKDAYPAEFPWMVRIYMFEEHQCGGSLITRRHVLTAAHCLENFFVAEPYYTVVETMDGNNRSVETVYLHESYDYLLSNNDIAIITLSNPVSLSDSVQTICLPQYQYFYNQNQWGIVTGWGFTDETRKLSDHLLKTSVKLMSGEECVTTTSWERERITENMFCAIGNNREDSCNGDSGGPLQVLNDRGAMELAGIVSKGKNKKCGYLEFPGVYTDVFRYLSWINNYIRGEDLCRLPN